jgi:preprotein translocase subunit SecE
MGVRISPPVHGITKSMNKVFGFIKGSVDEMTNNVTWSKYSELQSSTILVIIASIIFAILIGLIDLSFKTIMEYIYG